MCREEHSRFIFSSVLLRYGCRESLNLFVYEEPSSEVSSDHRIISQSIPGITSLHLANDPLLAFLVSHVGPPCG